MQTKMLQTLCVLLGVHFVQTMPLQAAPASAVAEKTGNNATVLLNAADIARLRGRKNAFAALLRAGTAQLDYVPKPMPVFAPDPHYKADGVSASANNGKQLAADAQAAYRAGMCYLLTGEVRFAANAQRILDAWATTLTQVATEQGKSDVNFNLPSMIAAASWVRGANDWNSAPYDGFLQTTILPVSSAAKSNNHGFWGVLMEACAFTYLQDDGRLSKTRERWQELIRTSVAADGSLPQEIERSGTSNWRGGKDKGVKGMAYTHYALLPAGIAAKIFADGRKPVWATDAGKLLHAAFDRAAAWTLHPETFPFYASNNGQLVDVRNAAYFALLLNFYPNKDAETVLKQGKVGMNGFLLLELFGQ